MTGNNGSEGGGAIFALAGGSAISGTAGAEFFNARRTH